MATPWKNRLTRSLAILFLFSLLPVKPADADVHRVRLEGRGVYLTGVAFFGAVPFAEKDDTLSVEFGDLEKLSWVPGALPVVDAHVMLVNSTGLQLPEIQVKVSLYLGVGSLSALPEEEDMVPGAEGIQEQLFFERVFKVSKFVHATIRRVSVSDIHLSEVIEDQTRQGRWPGYLRVEALVVGKPEQVAAPVDMTTDFLRIVMRDVSVKPAAGREPAAPGSQGR
jgi:hypothetical protein